MKIKTVEISNWRSVVHEKIVFDDLMIFIGQNNHGKSNILSSVLFFFGEIALHELDFHGSSDELWVEIEFTDLNESEITTFQKYVTNGNTIKVRKLATKIDGFSYHGYLQEPTEPWLKEDNISNYTSRDASKDLPLAVFLPKTGRITKEIFRQAQKDYFTANQESIVLNYTIESSSFLGAKNVAKGIFGAIFFIPSIKRAADELSVRGNSVFNQLYSRVINRMSETDPKFIEAKEKIEQLSKILNKNNDDGKPNQNRPKDLTSLEALLDEELKGWQAKIDIQISPPNVDDIFRIGASVWVDDGIKTDIERKGHGLQRALIFALLRAWSKTTKQEKESSMEPAEQVEETKKSSRKASKASYFVFEEPELFLHPQAQKELFASLVSLSNEDNQIILCTHSSSFLDMEHHKSICIVRKDTVQLGTKVLQCSENIFSDLEDRKKFNLSYWINPDRSELFFAEKVVLLEGQTDKSVIPLLAKKIGVFKYEYTLIDCGSKDTIPQYINLLNKFRLKYVVVYDRDHQAGKGADGVAMADKSSKHIEDFVNKDLGNTIVLINDIEEELSIAEKVTTNKPYIAIEHIESEDFELSETFKAKIEAIYQ